MRRHYRPSFGSFLGSVAYSLTPAMLVVIVGYFRDWDFSIFFWVLNAVLILLSAGLILQDVVVHFGHSLEVSADEICLHGLGGTSRITWDSIQSAVLRSRKNPVTRDDHLLILSSSQGDISFVTSTLPEADEKELLDFVKQRIQLIEQFDTPAI